MRFVPSKRSIRLPLFTLPAAIADNSDALEFKKKPACLETNIHAKITVAQIFQAQRYNQFGLLMVLIFNYRATINLG